MGFLCYKSGVQGGAKASSSEPPAGPLAPHLAAPNRVLEGGVCTAQAPLASALLCYDFSLRSESIGCSFALRCFLAEPNEKNYIRSFQYLIYGLCGLTRKGPRRSEARKGNERGRSRSTQIAKQNRSAGKPGGGGAV